METHYRSDSLPEPPRLGGGLNGVVIALLAIAVAILGWRTYREESALRDPNAAPRTVVPRADLSLSEKSVIELYRAASPAVVHINTVGLRRDLQRNVLRIPAGSGSGFMWDEQGHVVTNFHVIEPVLDTSSEIYVTLSGKETWTAEVVGYAADHDVAVLKVKGAPAGGFAPLPVGSSRDLQVGQQVFAIGNPFGLDQTLTTGVISGLDREILSRTQRPISGVIQTDAAINPGNSGGPLLDSAGRLVGVNTSIYSPSGASVGIGFAVPVDTINRIVPQIIRTGRVYRPLLGFTIVDPATATQVLGVNEGVVVNQVIDGSGAQAAGFRPLAQGDDGSYAFDVVLQVADRQVRALDDVYRELDGREFGQVVPVHIRRDGRDLTLDVELRRYTE